MDASQEKPRLLIADDEPANISTLVAALRDDYRITIARNGLEALERAEPDIPDLFLLDIQMPEMNGYDVCRRIRANAPLKSVPVIFITSMDAEEDESLGFEVGANDYITKPFSPSIVVARVKTQIDLKQHRDHLEALAEARARQLVHSERLATLGTLSAGVAHEINNPLACISAYAELLGRMQKQLVDEHRIEIEAVLGAEHPALAFIDDCAETASTLFESSDRIARIVSSMQTFAKREKDEPQLTALRSCVDKALNLCAYALKRKVTSQIDLPDDLPEVMIRPQQIEQVLINLINNASHAIQETGREGIVSVSARHRDDRLVITVEDTGPGIPSDKLETIWEAFYTTKGDKGTGLGLSISRGIIDDHKGNIRVENKPDGGGARFTIELPVAPKTAQE